MSATTLYAWAVPGFFQGSPVDHTWVTTYDNRQNVYKDAASVAAASEEYWFCWGDFHQRGGTPVDPTGFLGAAAGSRSLAKCLVKSNADSRVDNDARGTIFRYGRDGVCHQLANQVLFPTGHIGLPPLLVRHARGYAFSSAIYGDYGLQAAAWRKKVTDCGHGADATIERLRHLLKEAAMDDFERRARAVLKAPDDKKRLDELLHIRKQHQEELRSGDVTYKSAQEINAKNQQFFDQAAKLLGAERYRAIFGDEPEVPVDLVDSQVRDSIPHDGTR